MIPLTVSEIKAAGGYPVIMADPAWSYNDKGSNGAADNHYPTMTLEELCALPVREIAAPDAVLFLWGVYPMTLEAFTLADAWGFPIRTLGFQWVKLTGDGPEPKLHFGLGRWTRGNTEPCWLGVRGSPNSSVVDRAIRQVVITDPGEELIVSPRTKHSRKPPEVRTRIEKLFGDVPRLELFARERFPGWDAWGNEIVSDLTF